MHNPAMHGTKIKIKSNQKDIELVYNWAFQRFLKRPMSLYAFYHVYGVASF
jgi:hypothetical protein